jgi:integrase
MSMPAMPLSTSVASLRLFAPDEDPTLLQLYKEKLEHKRGAPTTAAADREAIKKFEEANPALPARKINEEHVLKFLEHMRARFLDGSLALPTINRHCRHLGQVLKQLGPPPKSQKKMAGFWNDGKAGLPFLSLLAEPPSVEAPPVEEGPVEHHLELDEIGTIYGVCETLTWKGLMPNCRTEPSIFRIPAPLYWRAVFTLAYHTGLRRVEMLKGQRKWLVIDRHGHWLDVPKVKRVSTRRFVYLNKHAREAMAVLNQVESDCLLAWPFGDRYFDARVRDIFDRTAIQRLKDLEIKIKGFRKTCATQLTMIDGSELASLHLGHALGTMTTRRYTHHSAITRFVEQLPEPEPIAPPPQPEPQQIIPMDPQRLLFE